MPFYDYKCTSCGRKLELFRPVSECKSAKCPHCGATAERIYEGKWNCSTTGNGGGCSGHCAGCAGCASGK